MIAAPPSEAGADHDTVACPLPGVAFAPVGAPGTVADADGITGVEAADAGPVPTPFVAVTVKVYDVPSVRPVTVTGLVVFIAVNPPGDDVTV